jgi:hypothetical protein
VGYTLANVRGTFRARHSKATRSFDRFRLYFQLDGRQPDFRSFDSVVERDAFFDASIRDRKSGGPGKRLVLAFGLPDSWGHELAKDDLEAVTFVADYFQLQFHEGITNVYVWPTIHTPGRAYDVADPGYRDLLTSLIGATVEAADLWLDDGLVIDFKTAELAISPERMKAAPWEIVEGHGGDLDRNHPIFSEFSS